MSTTDSTSLPSSKTIKTQPPRIKTNHEYIDATPIIQKVNNELLEYRMNKYKNKHSNDILYKELQQNNNNKKHNNTSISDDKLDAQVQKMLKENLKNMQSMTQQINLFGSTYMHNKDKKQIFTDTLVKKGAKRQAEANIPFNIKVGMKHKQDQRIAAREQRQRDMGIYNNNNNKKHKHMSYNEYEQNKANRSSIDNGLHIKFGHVDSKGVLNVSENELNNVNNQRNNKFNGLKQTFHKRNNKRNRK